jgi:hypothetical protein
MNMTDDLDAVLRELAENEPFSPVPVEDLLARGKRRRRAGMSAAALGVAAVVVVGVVGATVIGGPGPSSRPAEPLTTAARPTGETTFRFVVTARSGEHNWRQEGAYDPAGPKGYLKYRDLQGNAVEQRFIGADVYYLGSIHENGARPLITTEDAPEGPVLGLPLTFGEIARIVDPGALLGMLRELGTVTDLGGDRYSFRHPGNGYAGSVSGTVEVRSGRVAKVTFEMIHTSMTLEFSEYGVPVAVERP